MITTSRSTYCSSNEKVPYASEDFSWLLSGVTLAAKMVEAKTLSAGLSDIVGAAGNTNVQGKA